MKTLLWIQLCSIHFTLSVAWGAVGHEIVATIAQIYLRPTTVEKLCSLLPAYADCHLAPVAAWADKVRPFYRWSSHMHYIGDVTDHPGDHCAFGEGGWEDAHTNIITAVQNTSMWLQEGRNGGEEAIKFLIHFLGDLHMPLHLTGRARGGNEIKVRFDGRITNLHSVWDSRMIAKTLRTIPSNYTLPLPSAQVENALRDTIYDPYIRQIVWEGLMGRWKDDFLEWLACPPSSSSEPNLQQVPMSSQAAISQPIHEIICPEHWARPIHALNCQIVWPKALEEDLSNLNDVKGYLELDSPEYSGKIKEEFIIEKLFAAGGIRLAGILNYLLDDSELQDMYM